MICVWNLDVPCTKVILCGAQISTLKLVVGLFLHGRMLSARNIKVRFNSDAGRGG